MIKALLIGCLLLIAGLFIFRFWPENNLQSPDIPVKTAPSIAPLTGLSLLSPLPDSTLIGPLVIRGYVPQNWTFEGQFRMQLLDNNRRLIIEDRVPIEWNGENKKESLYFVESYNYHTTADSGFLVLENDNPSGLPGNRKSMEIQVKFAPTVSGTVYLFDQASDNTAINNQCLVVLPRAVNIGLTKSPVKDTLNLLAGQMHSGFYVKSLNLKNGLLTVEFPDIAGFTAGGSCAQAINTAKVVKTALQFPEVKQVKIIPDSIFQP